MNEEMLLADPSSTRRSKVLIGLSLLFGLLLVGALWKLGDPQNDAERDESINKLLLAKKYLGDGRLDLAEVSLLAHLQRHPQSVEALEELRWLYFNQFRTREIETVLETHLARFPEDFGAAIELLNCEFRKQLPREGIGYLREINQRQPGQPFVLLALGYCHWQIGELEAARTVFETVLTKCPDHEEARCVISEFLLENGETEAAAELLKNDAESTDQSTILNAGTDNDRVWFLRSVVAERRGNIDMAYQEIKRAISLRSSELSYVHREGLLLQRLGRQEEATKKLQRANVLEGFQTELSEIVLRGQHAEPTPEICARIAKLLHEFAREVPARSWHQFGLRMTSAQSERRP